MRCPKYCSTIRNKGVINSTRNLPLVLHRKCLNKWANCVFFCLSGTYFICNVATTLPNPDNPAYRLVRKGAAAFRLRGPMRIQFRRQFQNVNLLNPKLPSLASSTKRDGSILWRVPQILWNEDAGQDIAEYAVMLAVILVIVVGTIRLIGSNSDNVFSSVSSSLQ
jgi:Flp pilus assembly pilin Flp